MNQKEIERIEKFYQDNPQFIAYLRETDKKLNFPPGTSEAQIYQESRFKTGLTSNKGAYGIAQFTPESRALYEKRLGRKTDPNNIMDAAELHRLHMEEAVQKTNGTVSEALMYYHAGPNRSGWGKNTNEYPNLIRQWGEKRFFHDKAVEPQASQPLQSPQRSPQAPTRETVDYSNTGNEGFTTGHEQDPTSSLPPPQAGPGDFYQYKPVGKDIDPATLAYDQDWLQASAVIHRMKERQPFEGTDEELADYGKNFMGYFNSNMVDMGRYALMVKNATDDEKRAFVYLMDSYDNTNVSLEGTWRYTKGMLTDPTNLVSVGTLGLGAIGKQTAQKATTTAAKEGIKQMLKTSLGRTGIIGAVDGAFMGGAHSTIKQDVEVSVGKREETSRLEVMGHAGIGAGMGAAMGTATDLAVTGIRKVLGKFSLGSPTAEQAVKASSKASETVKTGAETPKGVSKVSEASTSPIPSGNILTEAEMKQAAGRQQKGRLPVDDVVPDHSEKQNVSINVPEINSGLRHTAASVAETHKAGAEVAVQLKGLSDEELGVAIEKLRMGRYSDEERAIVSSGIQQYSAELRVEHANLIKKLNAHPDAPPAEIAAINKQIEDMESRVTTSSLWLADDAFGSGSGSALRMRQGIMDLGGNRGVTLESLMAEGMTKDQARVELARLVDSVQASHQANLIAIDFDAKIKAAMDAGDHALASNLVLEKGETIAALTELAVPKGASIGAKAVEVAISNVFSPTTLMVNLVPSALKTLIVPAVKAVVSNPLLRATRVAMVAEYSAFKSSMGMAARAAKAAYKYEQSILTKDTARLLEGELANTGKFGGALRTIPRLLNATDEFLAQLNYNSFIAGHVAGDAFADGTQQGLQGKALKDFVKGKVEEAMEQAYRPPNAEELVNPIISKGKNLGLSKDDLAKYVEREVVKDPEALRKGVNEEAMDFARDVLYKRKFSGNNYASKAAQWYETGTNKVPTLKLLTGQLFFRTPVRVFEEGIRLTPGLQLLSPGFIADLAGRNGVARQVRAQGESMASIAIASTVISLYAQGRIRGDGAYGNWRQEQLRNDSALPPTYTLVGEDGGSWSFRSFDPISTPMKIMVNALERMDQLAIREAQGEFIDKAEYQKGVAMFTVAMGATASAIRDANLVSGIEETIKFGEMLADPEEKEAAWLKAFGDRLKWLTPNTMLKIARQNDPTIKDPATFWQMVQTRLDPFGMTDNQLKTSHSYDVLGNKRELADTGALWNIFSVATVDERARGKPQEALVVMQELDRLSRETGAIFATSYKHELTGGLDLRTVTTSDGKETLYDRWNAKFKALKPEEVLYPIVMAPMPDGTFGTKGARVEAVQDTLKTLRNAAFEEMVAEEQVVLNRMIREQTRKAQTQAGMHDYQNTFK